MDNKINIAVLILIRLYKVIAAPKGAHAFLRAFQIDSALLQAFKLL